MAPARRKRAAAAAAASAAAAAAQWKVGDLVLAKMKGFPAWPAMISEPQQWGLSSAKKKLLVYFYGTKQIAFCNYADLQAFTEEKKKSLLVKRQGKGADFVRAVNEIVKIYESLKKKDNDKLSCSNVRPDVENIANSNCSVHTEDLKDSTNLANDKLEGHSVSSSGHNMISTYEPYVASIEGEHCVMNSTPDEPIEKVSMLDKPRHNPLRTGSFSRNKRQSDAQQQSSSGHGRFASVRVSRNLLSVALKTIQNPAGLPTDTSLASVDLGPDDQQEYSPSATKDDVLLCSNQGTCNQLGTSGISNDDKNSSFTTKVRSTCNSEVCGVMEKEMKLNEMYNLPMNTTVIFKRKRKADISHPDYSMDCAASDKDEELRHESSGNLVNSSNSRIEVNKSDGDKHLPLVKRARVRMGRPLPEDSIVDEPDVSNNKTRLASCADQRDKHDSPAICGKDHSTDGMPPDIRNVSNPSPKVDLPVPSGEVHPTWKNKEYKPKVLTFDVEAALPPSKRLHRALEAMSANAAGTISNVSELTELDKLILKGCMTSAASSPSNKSADMLFKSPKRSAITRSPEICLSTHSLHNPTSQKRTPQPVISNHNAPSPSERKKDDSHNLLTERVCEEIHMDRENNSQLFVCAKIDDVVCGKSPTHSMELNKPAIDVPYSVLDQLPSSLEKASENERMKPIDCSAYDVSKNVGGSAAPVSKTKVVVSDTNGVYNYIPHGETVLAEPIINVGDRSSTSSLVTKSSSIQSDAGTRSFEVHALSALALKELNNRMNLKDTSLSPDSMPMKELIAAVQARRFTRSSSFTDNFLDSKVISEALVNTPSLKEGSGSQISPSNHMIRSTSATDSAHPQQNGGRTAFDNVRHKGFNTLAGHDEARAARRSFEAFLGTLTRTKESIARATCLAMECAKYAIAGEVIDIILERLEKESNLYKRVDLFFLVDSIIQSCRSQKGGARDVYPSLIQEVLPQLLYASAPPGNSAWENRRQCLKVLKLWLERKTFPEYFVRHHIRELEVLNEASFGSSRRPSMTERALNDPLRENEGMLVDEYGSNTGFHLPNLICTKLLEDEEGSLSEERSFEAVTPEHEVMGTYESEASQLPLDKHRRILEEVDGELEMEDVAPPSEARASSAYHPGQTDTLRKATNQHLNSIPPLPDDRPPSPPPLPSSPPPLPHPPLPVAQGSQVKATFHVAVDPVEPRPPRATYNFQCQHPHSVAEHQGSMDPCITPSQPPSFYNSGYVRHPNQVPLPPLNTPRSHGDFSGHPAPHHGNNYHQQPTAPLPNEAYQHHLQPPPPPPVPNQFPYIPLEPQQRTQHWSNNCSSYSGRYQYNGQDRGHQGHDRRHHFNDRGHHFDDRECHFDDRAIEGPMHHEVVHGGRFPPPFPPGTPISDHFEASPGPLHYRRPPDPPPVPCPGWSVPPRISKYHPAPRHSLEEPPVSHGGWRRHGRHSYDKYRR